jgi:hypothetical protein
MTSVRTRCSAIEAGRSGFSSQPKLRQSSGSSVLSTYSFGAVAQPAATSKTAANARPADALLT